MSRLLENGAQEFIYYDERVLECGRTEIACESLNEQNQPVVLKSRGLGSSMRYRKKCVIKMHGVSGGGSSWK
jgi:hypothetical protein